jgi:hypothetical protein
MDKARLEDLMEKGYVTRVLSGVDQDALATKSEKELIELGYITHIGFDGVDSTAEEEVPAEDEVPVEEEVPAEDDDLPVVDDENIEVPKEEEGEL